MKKLRLVFVLLTSVILVPVLLLVSRALENAEAQRSAQYRTLAERALDEMEQELTTFLKREENRPFEHYRTTYLPEGIYVPTRSPLAEPPAEPFVLGYFEVDAAGNVTHPLDVSDGPAAKRRDLAAANVRRLWGPSAPAYGGDLRTAGTKTLPSGKSSDTAIGAENAGADVRFRKAPVELNEKAESELKKLPQERFLESLNRAASRRDAREAQTQQTQASNVGTQEQETDTEAAGSFDEFRVIDVRLEPMVGRAADNRLVLYRTVVIEAEVYRQGLVIETAELLAWLAGRVLIDHDLAAGVSLFRPRSNDGGYSYRHRFADPFGSVETVLYLAELPGLDGTAYLYALSFALALAVPLGLLALYRMVAVVVEYAERRNNFVSAVTHELKTPLTAIRMYGEMLRDGVVPDESKRQRYYETITSETERLTRLLQNVLELARLEKDTRQVHLVAGDVAEVVEEVLSVLGPHAASQGFELRAEIGEGLPHVLYDHDALLQVLFNLVDNALKYSRRAEDKKIVVSCRRAGAGVAVTVVDHGPGVTREHLGKIFEPFYRGESELTRTAKGTGIGLALVRGLVERMGGSVVGRNAPDGGFEVEVTLLNP